MDTKICNMCGIEKDTNDFYSNRKRCKKCFLKYNENNPNFVNNRKNYYQNNKDNILKKTKIYQNDRYDKNKNNLEYKLPLMLRCRFRLAIKNAFKSVSCIDLLGCSIEDCRKHLESKFKSGMTWDNHGIKGWHIDHIIPCSSLNLLDIEEQKKCFHYTNLQPLWWYENLAKGSHCNTSS